MAFYTAMCVPTNGSFSCWMLSIVFIPVATRMSWARMFSACKVLHHNCISGCQDLYKMVITNPRLIRHTFLGQWPRSSVVSVLESLNAFLGFNEVSRLNQFLWSRLLNRSGLPLRASGNGSCLALLQEPLSSTQPRPKPTPPASGRSASQEIRCRN